jgi:NADPH2:quinone reductase
MNHAIRVHEYGGPEKMVWEDVPLPAPKPGEALVRHQAVGLNYIDVYFRTGLYKAPSLPATIGMEGAGIVEAVGEGVTNVAPGDRVAYATAPIGAYAEARSIKADRLVKVPEAIAFEQAAAMMLQGMTACFLLTRTYKVQPGQTILIHAAAGGVGLIMTQWAKHLGCTVIGCVSTEEKAALVKAHGADHTVVGIESLPARVREITGGAMLPVVFDSVGRDTFTTSLDCLTG